MILHVTTLELEWTETSHSRSPLLNKIGIAANYHAEVYYYKNEDVTIHVSFRIVEHDNSESNFEVLQDTYTHISPKKIRFESTEHKLIGHYKTLAEAKDAAQNYFNHHHYLKGNH